MLIPRVLLALCALSASAVIAQGPGALVVNTGNSINCVTATGENGFNIQSWGIGGTLNTARLSLGDITLVKTVDACSGQLQQKFLSGVDLPSFTLTQYLNFPNGTGLPILQVTLTNPVMNTYSISGSQSAQPSETITVNFSKFCIKEWKQNPDGTLNAQPQICYNVLTNTTGSN